MRLRLVRPALKYLTSFKTVVYGAGLGRVAALEYLTSAEESEYWLVDGRRYLGRVWVHKEAVGRKAITAAHIAFDTNPYAAYLDYEAHIIRLAVRKAWKLGINPVLLICYAAAYERRERIERRGGILLRTVRERSKAYHGRVCVYSCAQRPPKSVPGEAGELSVDIARCAEPEALARPAVENLSDPIEVLLPHMPQ